MKAAQNHAKRAVIHDFLLFFAFFNTFIDKEVRKKLQHMESSSKNQVQALTALIGECAGCGTLYLYELVGECVYLYVGWGKCSRRTDGRTNDDRGKDVVPRDSC